jgi:hypothetical protein
MREFMLWCYNKLSDLSLPERIYPNEDKLVAFLQQEVFNREVRLKRKTGDHVGLQVVGAATVDAYVAAVTWQWDHLKRRNLLSSERFPTPNGSKTKGAVNTFKLNTHTRNRSNRKDRLLGSFKDGLLSRADYHNIFNYFWNFR